MIDYFKTIFLAEGFQDNWAAVTLVMIVLALCIRFVFLRGITKSLRELHREVHRAVTRLYMRQALWGWGWLVAAVLLAVGVWFQPSILTRFIAARDCYLLAFIMTVVGSYVHVRNYTMALIAVLKQRTELEG